MSFVSGICISCERAILLDDAMETGFCSYCGSKQYVKETIKKLGFSGNESNGGITELQKLLKNAETFHKLKEFQKEKELWHQIIESYPGDYRVWWGLAQLYMCSSVFGFPYKLGCGVPDVVKRSGVAMGSDNEFFYSKLSNELSEPIRLINNAVVLAPPDNANTMKHIANEWIERIIRYLENEKVKLTNANEYVIKINEISKKQNQYIENNQNKEAKTSTGFFGLMKKSVEVNEEFTSRWDYRKELEKNNIDEEDYNSLQGSSQYGYHFKNDGYWSSDEEQEKYRQNHIKEVDRMIAEYSKWTKL